MRESSARSLDPYNSENRRYERYQQGYLCQLLVPRQPGEPRIDGLKIALDDGEIGAGLICLAQREAGFRHIGHRGRLPEDG
jgi:hypothetical protein